MTVLDRQVLFSNDQAITATAASTDIIDLGSSPRDVGAGEMSTVLVLVTEAFNNLSTHWHTELARDLRVSDRTIRR
jgi:hypothetical protein